MEYLIRVRVIHLQKKAIDSKILAELTAERLERELATLVEINDELTHWASNRYPLSNSRFFFGNLS